MIKIKRELMKVFILNTCSRKVIRTFSKRFKIAYLQYFLNRLTFSGMKLTNLLNRMLKKDLQMTQLSTLEIQFMLRKQYGNHLNINSANLKQVNW